MKAFLVAVAAIVVVSAGAGVVLKQLPMSASDVHKTDNVRLD